MDNVFLPGLSAQQRLNLEASGITAYDLSVGAEEGLIIEADQLPGVLSVLGARVIKEAATTYHGIKRVELHIHAKHSAEVGAHTASNDSACNVAAGLVCDDSDSSLVGLFRSLVRNTVTSLLPENESSNSQKNRFVAECCQSAALAPAITAGGATSHKEAVKRLKKQLSEHIRQAKSDEQRLLRGEGLSPETFGIEYEGLLKIPKVKDVRFEGHSIVIFTDVLYCRDDRTGRLHEIGAFKIQLPLDGYRPIWTNLTRRVDAMKRGQHAPHIWPDGTACTGSAGAIFSDLFCERQFAVAAQLAIRFVEHANTKDSAGKYINHWPQAGLFARVNQSAPASQGNNTGWLASLRSYWQRVMAGPQSQPNADSALDASHERFRQQYIDACSARSHELLAEARQAVIQHHQIIEVTQANLIAEIRAALKEEREAAGQSLIDRTAYSSEFEALLLVEKVRNVHIEPGIISLTTEMLYVFDRHLRRQHEIGEFLIKIHFSGQDDAVRWFNLTRRVDASQQQPLAHAPNVLSDGRALFSDIREVYPDLIANMQFSTVARMAIEFIEQVDVEETAGARIYKWPWRKS